MRVRLLVLGSAGVGAFYAASHFSRGAVASDAPPGRPGASASAPIPAAPRPLAIAMTPSAAIPAGMTRAAAAASAARVAAADVAASSASSGPAASASAAAMSLVDRNAMIPRATGEPFATLSWLPPPPPPPPPVAAAPPPPPAAPVAPALPFVFVGMVEQGTPKPQAFLSKGDALLIVSAGDTIDNGAYHVELMDSSQIVLVHLATNTRQAINLSGVTK